MGKKKHVFSKEEKELIRQKRIELSIMGVPREEWSSYIQQALKVQQKSKKFMKADKKKTGISGAIQQVRNKVEGKVQKVISKRYNMGTENFDDMVGNALGVMSEEEMELMNSMSSGANLNIGNTSSHGTFIMDRPDKKRMILDFDEDDD